MFAHSVAYVKSVDVLNVMSDGYIESSEKINRIDGEIVTVGLSSL